MAIKGAGASFKIASAAYVLTEVATWLNEISGDASTDEIDGTVFSPGATSPVKTTLYGATDRSHTLSGRWSPAAEAFFSAIDGLTYLAYEYSPEGTAVGKTRIYGTCNVGAWSGPQQSVDGVIGFSIGLKINTRYVETIPTLPATISITSSSASDPTVLTTAAHGITVGARDVVTITGHTGSTPSINGTFEATSLTTTTLSLTGVATTVGGTGGTLQK